MASDNLNEVGKYMKKTRDDANYALGRYLQKRSRIERARDVFSSDLSFVMYFDVGEDETVSMEVNFKKPPPGHNFGTGSCEQFSLGTTDGIFTTNYPYESGSLSVFINEIEQPTSQYSEYDISAQQVFVKGGIYATNTLVICYVRTA